MWLSPVVSKNLCGLNDAYISTVDSELPPLIVFILTVEKPIGPLASISPELIWDPISIGQVLPKGVRRQDCL